jgi:hypothetical protein
MFAALNSKSRAIQQERRERESPVDLAHVGVEGGDDGRGQRHDTDEHADHGDEDRRQEGADVQHVRESDHADLLAGARPAQ